MFRHRSSLSPASTPEMNPVLWSKLPEELLEQILSCLPLKTFLNLRSTCKHFKSLISSPFFISKHSSSPSKTSSSTSKTSLLLLSHPHFLHQYSLYDSNLNSWRTSPLTLSSILPPSALLLFATNGILCFSVPGNNSFLICNLLANSSRIVKFPSNLISSDFKCLNLILTTKGFQLFFLCVSSGLSAAFLYNSRAESWRRFEFKINNHDHFNVNCGSQGVCHNNSLYFTTREPNICVVGFNLGKGKLWRMGVDLPGGLVFARLVGDGVGKLYLFGGIGRNGISRSLKLWGLGEGGENWVEMINVPDMMCRKLVSVCFHNYEDLYVFWHEGLVCVCCYSWPEVLYYRVGKRTWHWLPKSPLMPEKWSRGFKWFSFIPELHAF